MRCRAELAFLATAQTCLFHCKSFETTSVLGTVHRFKQNVAEFIEFGAGFSTGKVQDLALSWIEAHAPFDGPLM